MWIVLASCARFVPESLADELIDPGSYVVQGVKQLSYRSRAMVADLWRSIRCTALTSATERLARLPAV